MKRTYTSHLGVSKKPRFVSTMMIFDKGPDKQEVEFCYLSGLLWTCIRCGKCCQDLDDRKRRILLLNNDIERIRSAGNFNFYEIITLILHPLIIKNRSSQVIYGVKNYYSQTPTRRY